ncbi:MAG: hypothetical protein ACREBF_04260 [Candidatus Micrarchaeales archaeon]
MTNLYLKGVGIGLVIAWVTSALAYLVVRNVSKDNWRAKLPVAKLLIALELVLSAVFLALSFLM